MNESVRGHRHWCERREVHNLLSFEEVVVKRVHVNINSSGCSREEARPLPGRREGDISDSAAPLAALSGFCRRSAFLLTICSPRRWAGNTCTQWWRTRSRCTGWPGPASWSRTRSRSCRPKKRWRWSTCGMDMVEPVRRLKGSPQCRMSDSCLCECGCSRTYISMKMEPNGRIPPRQTMTAGSMNLRTQHPASNPGLNTEQGAEGSPEISCIIVSWNLMYFVNFRSRLTKWSLS